MPARAAPSAVGAVAMRRVDARRAAAAAVSAPSSLSGSESGDDSRDSDLSDEEASAPARRLQQRRRPLEPAEAEAEATRASPMFSLSGSSPGTHSSASVQPDELSDRFDESDEEPFHEGYMGGPSVLAGGDAYGGEEEALRDGGDGVNDEITRRIEQDEAERGSEHPEPGADASGHEDEHELTIAAAVVRMALLNGKGKARDPRKQLPKGDLPSRTAYPANAVYLLLSTVHTGVKILPHAISLSSHLADPDGILLNRPTPFHEYIKTRAHADKDAVRATHGLSYADLQNAATDGAEDVLQRWQQWLLEGVRQRDSNSPAPARVWRVGAGRGSGGAGRDAKHGRHRSKRRQQRVQLPTAPGGHSRRQKCNGVRGRRRLHAEPGSQQREMSSSSSSRRRSSPHVPESAKPMGRPQGPALSRRGARLAEQHPSCSIPSTGRGALSIQKKIACGEAHPPGTQLCRRRFSTIAKGAEASLTVRR